LSPSATSLAGRSFRQARIGTVNTPARSEKAVEDYFDRQLDALLDAPIGKLGIATRIFDAMTGQSLRG
jgi:hypothetical protein